MITHIVLLSLSEPERAGELAAQLRALNGQIPGMISMDAGADTTAGDYDLGLVSTFTDAEALAAYQTHPLHQAFVAVIKPLITGRAVLDFDKTDQEGATP